MNRGPNLAHMQALIASDKLIPRANKKYAESIIVYLQAKNSDEKTIIKWLYNLIRFSHSLEVKKDFKDLTKDDIERAMARINTGNYAEWTKATIRWFVKAFWKNFFGEGLYYPKQVAGIKIGRPKSKLLPTDMLTEDDIKKLIDAARNIRDKTIIAVLYDGGLRIGELIQIRKRDVMLDANPSFVAVNGKTGIRQVVLTFSVPYLASYFNEYKDLQPADFLWSYLQKGARKPYEYDAINMMIKRAATDAHLNRRVWNHLFRHSRATWYSNKLTDRQLEKLFGWSPGSRMPATYSHLSTNDINNAVLVANGMRPIEKQELPKLRARVCPRCQFENMADAVFCQRCGAGIDIDTAMQQTQNREVLQEVMVDYLKDKDSVVKLLKKIAAEKKQKEQ